MGDTYNCSSGRRQEQWDIVTWMANTFHYCCRLEYIYIYILWYGIILYCTSIYLARWRGIRPLIRGCRRNRKRKKSERNGMHKCGQICRNVRRKKIPEYIILLLYCLVCRCNRRQRWRDGRRLTADRAGKYIIYSLLALIIQSWNIIVFTFCAYFSKILYTILLYLLFHIMTFP